MMDWGENIGWSEDDTIAQQALTQRALKRKVKADQICTKKAKALAELCNYPKEGEQWRIMTEKQFNAFAFIKYLLEHETIEELYISIYRINQPIVENLISLIKGGTNQKGSLYTI